MENELILYIEKLTETWIQWMASHIISNDASRSFRDRRVHGEKCEKLVQVRQAIINDIDNLPEWKHD